MTGIYDVLGLISVTIDPLEENLKKENLCLIGGKASNLVSRELYSDFIPTKFHFYSSEGGINIHGSNFRGGGYGTFC